MSLRNVVFAILFSLAASGISWLALQKSSLGDLRAFYCAGAVTRQHADAYLSEPLHSCEIETSRLGIYTVPHNVVVPAPLPPYTLAVFSAVSIFPFSVVAFVWILLLICTVAIAVIILFRLTGLGVIAIVSAMLLSVLGSSITIGQMVPFIIAAVCGAALYLRLERYAIAALFAAMTMFEPNIGLPVCISIALWIPRIRLPLLLSAAGMAILALTVGWRSNIEYISTVLPAHALSEVGSDEQYSLTVIANALGVTPKIAVLLGNVWYGMMLVFGIILARMAAVTQKDTAFYVAVPPAVTVIGGSFVHLTQIAVAIPLAVLLVQRTSSKTLAFGSLVLLALPWPMSQSPVFAIVAFAVVFALSHAVYEGTIPLALGCAIAAAVVVLGLNYLYGIESHPVAAPLKALAIDPNLAEASWARLMLRYYSFGDALSWIKRTPTWVGLILLLVSLLFTIRAAQRKNGISYGRILGL